MTFRAAHRLIKKGDLISLRHALDASLSPNLSNRFSWTLLMLAALEGNTSIGELLMERGAVLDSQNDFGETALSLAAHNGHIAFLQMLLAEGASTACSPHGHNLESYLRGSSGLAAEKIGSLY